MDLGIHDKIAVVADGSRGCGLGVSNFGSSAANDEKERDAESAMSRCVSGSLGFSSSCRNDGKWIGATFSSPRQQIRLPDAPAS